MKTLILCLLLVGCSASSQPTPSIHKPTAINASRRHHHPTPTPRPTPTPTPKPTPTPTPIPTPTPTPPPTPTPTPRPLRGMAELISGGDQVTGSEPGWTYPAITYERFRGDWASAEPMEGKPDFVPLDKAIDTAKATGKQIGVSYRPGDSFPPLTGAQFVNLGGAEVALPWDAVVATRYSNFMRLIFAHVKAKQATIGYNAVAYWVIGNIGNGLNTGMAKTQEEIDALDALGGLTAYNKNFDAMALLFSTAGAPFIIAASASPYVIGNQTLDGGALQADVDRNMAIYPQLGIMNTSLRLTGGSGLPYKLLTQYGKTSHPTLIQFVNCVARSLPKAPPTCDPMIPTCFADTLNTGISFNVNVIEIYTGDDIDGNQAAIADAGSRLR